MKIKFDYGTTQNVNPAVVSTTLSVILKGLVNSGVIGNDVKLGRIMVYPVFTDNDGVELDIDDRYFVVRNKEYARNARRRKHIGVLSETDKETGEIHPTAYIYELTND